MIARVLAPHGWSMALPHAAFLPRHPLSDRQRHDFVVRRNLLFARCTPEEQHRLIDLARWYDANDHRLIADPHILREARANVALHRVMPWMCLLADPPVRPPGLILRGLAKVADAVVAIEMWRGRRAQRRLVDVLERRLDGGDAEHLVGVLHFLRLLPIELGGQWDQHELPPALKRLAAASAEDSRVPAKRRFAAVLRCASWPSVPAFGHAGTEDVRMQVWRQLLAALEEDESEALRIIDTHREPHGRLDWPFSHVDLWADPALAYRLAMAIRPHRPDVGAQLLGVAIEEVTRRYDRASSDGMDDTDRQQLQRVVDASCAVLAEWVLAEGLLRPDAALDALRTLFWSADPAQSCWSRLPIRALSLLEDAPQLNPHTRVATLVCVAFYAPTGSAPGAAAMARLEDIGRQLMTDAAGATLDEPSPLTDFISLTQGLAPDTRRSGRNRRVPAQPDHPLLDMLDRLLDDLMARIDATVPEHALVRRAALIGRSDHEALVRKHHRLLRENFGMLARAHPGDAGRALQQLNRYPGFSQADDECYRKALCAQTFEQLLPMLEKISPADAAVARQSGGRGAWRPD